jgi:hypothetical protein
MLKSMAWNSVHYSAANRIAYGALFDNPLNFWPPRMRSGRRLRCCCSRRCCPPSLAAENPASPGGLPVTLRSGADRSSLPRWDLMHLLYVVPVFVVLAALWVERHLRGLAAPAVAAVVLMPHCRWVR